MEEKRFTFIYRGLAKVGYSFIYEGSASACSGCEYFKVCHGKLKRSVAYRVSEVRDKKVSCALVGEAVLVRVEPCEIEAALDAKRMVEGAIILFKPIDCGKLSCSHFNLCSPIALEGARERKFKIVRVTDSFVCPSTGVKLARVLLRPQEV